MIIATQRNVGSLQDFKLATVPSMNKVILADK